MRTVRLAVDNILNPKPTTNPTMPPVSAGDDFPPLSNADKAEANLNTTPPLSNADKAEANLSTTPPLSNADKAELGLTTTSISQSEFNRLMDNYLTQLAIKQPSDWSKEARAWCEANGIINGDEYGNRMYKKFLTREELISILYRLYGKR